MASKDFVYDLARALINQGGLNLASTPVGAALVTSGYSQNQATDQYLSDIPPAAIIADVDLINTGVGPAGQFFGTIPEFLSLLSTSPAVALVLYADTTVPSTSQLLYYSSTGPGFPFLPQGFNYSVGYDQSQGGFFQ